MIKWWEGVCSWSWWSLGQREVIVGETYSVCIETSILVMSSKVFKNQEELSLTTSYLADMQWQDGHRRQS